MNDCKKDEILRDAYTKKSGTRVKAACIKSTSASGKKAEDVNAPIIKTMLEKEKLAEKLTSSTSPKRCAKGEIRRAAYMREGYERKLPKSSSSTNVKKAVVPAACIKEQGKKDSKVGLINPVTGSRVYIVINDEYLHKFGYHVKDKTVAERHAALDKAYNALNKNWLSLFRTLNYLAVVNKSHPDTQSKFIADRDYVKEKYAPK